MPDYTFNTTSLAAIMREILIELMNRRTGFNPQTGENPAKAEDFTAVQPEIVKLRRKVLKAYQSQTFKPDVRVLRTEQIALTVYRLIVTDHLPVEHICRMSNRSLLRMVLQDGV